MGPSSGRESHDLWGEHLPPWAAVEQEKAGGWRQPSTLGWSGNGPSRMQPRQLAQSTAAVSGTRAWAQSV